MSDKWIERASAPEKSGAFTRFLYRTLPGRLLLCLLTRPFISKAAGALLDSPLSSIFVPPFIRRNGIDMTDYPETEYSSFNDFFTRPILPEARPICDEQDALIAPCDSRLSAYKINENSVFTIKDSQYSVTDLLGGNEELASNFSGGRCLIFRLCVSDYHRYIYFDACDIEEPVFIPGVLHTVRPIALERYNIYKRNSREYCVMHTEHFSTAVQVEVGAMMVGKIANNHQNGHHLRGEEKGKFLFGGSTVVLLLQPGTVDVDKKLLINTEAGYETVVKMGERIGTRK